MMVLAKPSLYLRGQTTIPKTQGALHNLQPKALVNDLSGAGTKYQTSSEVELEYEPLILTTVANIQALLGDSKDELKEDSDDEMLEAREELEHQSPSPHKDDPEPSNAKESTNASDSESSSCFETFNPFDNYMLIIEDSWVEVKATLLKALNSVSKTLEADSVLKASMQKMAEINNTTSGNITDLTELIRNANFP
ncbi:hypothetical protein Tco_0874866 [Tanacetum coccineum]|uniref:Uncharacterized protein n=1 Tax=Tanacetum coccineum TaxID=301880 RepID=A0ABQ5BMW0_9ASTR